MVLSSVGGFPEIAERGAAALVPPEDPEQPVKLALRIQRQGNRSIYGDITVTYISNGGESREVGRVQSVPVYTSITTRFFELPLTPPDDVELKAGRLEIVYEQSAFDRRKEPVVSKGKLDLP